MTIKLQGSSSGHVNLDAKATAANNTITLPDTTGGELVALESNGDLNIDSNSLFVDASTNKVGIGTNSPDTDSILHVYQPATNSSSELLIQNNRDKHTWTRYKTSTAHWITGNYGAWDEYHIVDADTGSIKVTVNTSGDVVPTGNLVLGSTKGINFDPQGGSNVNLLDDYEEGTFTPNWITVTNNASYAVWTYTKIGRQVTVNGSLVITSVTGTTGDSVYFDNLPFTSMNNPTNSLAQTVGTCLTSGIATGKGRALSVVYHNTTALEILDNGDNVGWDSVKHEHVNVNDQLKVCHTYFTA